MLSWLGALHCGLLRPPSYRLRTCGGTALRGRIGAKQMTSKTSSPRMTLTPSLPACRGEGGCAASLVLPLKAGSIKVGVKPCLPCFGLLPRSCGDCVLATSVSTRRGRSAAPHRVVQCLRRPARGGARGPFTDRRPLALRDRSGDVDGRRQGARLPPRRLAGGIDHPAQSRSGAGRLRLGTLDDAADAAGAGLPRRQRSTMVADHRRRMRANPQGRRVARTSTSAAKR